MKKITVYETVNGDDNRLALVGSRMLRAGNCVLVAGQSWHVRKVNGCWVLDYRTSEAD
jgi:hypothetical protein